MGDIRESLALKIARLLRERSGEVSYHDPHVPELSELELVSVDLEQGLGEADAAAIVTAHPEFDYERSSPAPPWWSTSAASPATSTRRTSFGCRSDFLHSARNSRGRG